MGFNKNGNLVAEIFMSLGKIIAGVLSILLFENNYSRALDKSKPTTIYFVLLLLCNLVEWYSNLLISIHFSVARTIFILSGYFLRTYIGRKEL